MREIWASRRNDGQRGPADAVVPRNGWNQEFWLNVRGKQEKRFDVRRGCGAAAKRGAFLEEMCAAEMRRYESVEVRACIGLEAPEARRTTAIGLSDLAEFYGSGDGSALLT